MISLALTCSASGGSSIGARLTIIVRCASRQTTRSPIATPARQAIATAGGHLPLPPGGGDHARRRRLARRQGRLQRVAARQRRGHGAGRPGPVPRLLLQATQDDPLNGRVHVAGERRGGRDGLLLVDPHQLVARAGFVDPSTREDLVENQPQRIQVALDARGAAGELLGRHVGRSPGDLRGMTPVGGRPGEAEIGDPDLAAPVEHDVGRLQIPVQDAPLVRGRQPPAELLGDLDALVPGKPADPAQEPSQILAVDILHRQEMLPVHLADVMDSADVGMGDLSGQPHLVVEVLQSSADHWPGLSAGT